MPLRLVPLPIAGMVMKKAKTVDHRARERKYSETISVTMDEKLFLKVLARQEGMTAAAVARRLMYSGLASYLADRKLSLPKPEFALQREVIGLLDTDPILRQIREVVELEKLQPSRMAGGTKQGSG